MPLPADNPFKNVFNQPQQKPDLRDAAATGAGRSVPQPQPDSTAKNAAAAEELKRLSNKQLNRPVAVSRASKSKEADVIDLASSSSEESSDAEVTSFPDPTNERVTSDQLPAFRKLEALHTKTCKVSAQAKTRTFNPTESGTILMIQQPLWVSASLSGEYVPRLD